MYYIYSRKSKYTGKGESIENQVEMCKEYIYSHINDVKDNEIIVYEDEGFSAKNLERPMFKKMMSDSKKQKVDYIVCYRLDRISRNVSDFSSLITDLNDRNISFVSIKEQFDTSTPMGRAMMYIASVFAQLERETIAERIRDNMLMLAKTGRWLGGIAPTGYESEKIEQIVVDGKSKQMFKLKIVPDEAKLVKLIFKKFIETNSLTKVETYLIQNNIKTKNRKAFTRFTIKNILENPVYMVADEKSFNFFLNNGVEFSEETDIKSKFDGKHGIMAYNKTIQKEGKRNYTRDIKDWIISVGKHDGLISSSDWILVQEQLAQNSSKSYRKPKSNVALLSGLLFCGNCGDYMRPKLSKRKNFQGEYIYSYLCQLKEKSRLHSCKMKNPNGNILDKAVCEEIKKLTIDDSEFLKELSNAKKQALLQSESCEEEILKISKSLSSIEREISSLVQALANATNTPAQKYITEKINSLDNEKGQLLHKLKELENLLRNQGFSQIEFDNIKNSALSFSNAFDTMNTEQKRNALRTIVDKIVWDGENIYIYLFGSISSKIPVSTININETPCEYRESYIHTTDTKDYQWHPLYNINKNLTIMSKQNSNDTTYSLLYIHKFNFLTPRKLLESQIFNIKYQDSKDIHTTAEKLRYFRYKKALLQKDVARQIGINQSTYISYESTRREYYPIDVLLKISNLYEVDITELLDEYNLFLYKGQGKQLKKLRKELGLTQQSMASKLNVNTRTIRQWEKNKTRMSKTTYTKIFKDSNSIIL